VAFSFGMLFFISTGFLFGKKREKMLMLNHLSLVGMYRVEALFIF